MRTVRSTITYGSVHCLEQRGTVCAGWQHALMWPEVAATVNWHWQVADMWGSRATEHVEVIHVTLYAKAFYYHFCIHCNLSEHTSLVIWIVEWVQLSMSHYFNFLSYFIVRCWGDFSYLVLWFIKLLALTFSVVCCSPKSSHSPISEVIAHTSSEHSQVCNLVFLL